MKDSDKIKKIEAWMRTDHRIKLEESVICGVCGRFLNDGVYGRFYCVECDNYVDDKGNKVKE